MGNSVLPIYVRKFEMSVSDIANISRIINGKSRKISE